MYFLTLFSFMVILKKNIYMIQPEYFMKKTYEIYFAALRKFLEIEVDTKTVVLNV